MSWVKILCSHCSSFSQEREQEANSFLSLELQCISKLSSKSQRTIQHRCLYMFHTDDLSNTWWLFVRHMHVTFHAKFHFNIPISQVIPSYYFLTSKENLSQASSHIQGCYLSRNKVSANGSGQGFPALRMQLKGTWIAITITAVLPVLVLMAKKPWGLPLVIL